MRAETDSNVYWLNLGLLGFLDVWPMMPTRCWSTTWNTGVSDWRAVSTTRMTPGEAGIEMHVRIGQRGKKKNLTSDADGD